jgi:hypothetical protein
MTSASLNKSPLFKAMSRPEQERMPDIANITIQNNFLKKNWALEKSFLMDYIVSYE